MTPEWLQYVAAILIVVGLLVVAVAIQEWWLNRR